MRADSPRPSNTSVPRGWLDATASLRHLLDSRLPCVHQVPAGGPCAGSLHGSPQAHVAARVPNPQCRARHRAGAAGGITARFSPHSAPSPPRTALPLSRGSLQARWGRSTRLPRHCPPQLLPGWRGPSPTGACPPPSKTPCQALPWAGFSLSVAQPSRCGWGAGVCYMWEPVRESEEGPASAQSSSNQASLCPQGPWPGVGRTVPVDLSWRPWVSLRQYDTCGSQHVYPRVAGPAPSPARGGSPARERQLPWAPGDGPQIPVSVLGSGPHEQGAAPPWKRR